jgi:hypothetical protein
VDIGLRSFAYTLFAELNFTETMIGFIGEIFIKKTNGRNNLDAIFKRQLA